MATQALGILEVKGFVTLMESMDAALKSADVTFAGWEKIGSGMVTGFVRGDVAAVKAAVEAGATAGKTVGEVVATQVIPRPHDELSKLGEYLA